MTSLDETLFTTPELQAVFSGRENARRLLEFEAALARAQARAGLIPAEAAEAIAAACRVEDFDLAALFRDAVPASTTAIPLVRMLTARVPEPAKGYVHWGATSQDVMDTALVLQLRDGLALVLADLKELAAGAAALAERYRATPMVGRTLLQQALPITFGLKAARWLALATRQTRALLAVRERVLVVQLGGAAGTLASLGEQGEEVARLLAEDLGLGLPDLPWHAERDRIGELAAALGVLAGSVAKIAGDVVLMMQTEVGEVAEGAVPGKGGSSAMPQKRNPVDAMEALALARLAIGQVPILLGAMVQEHERAVGGWQAEWAALPALFRYTGAAVRRVSELLRDLEVDPDRLRANLELSGGLVMAEALTMALAPRLGRHEAYRLVGAATKRALAEGADFRAVVHADPTIAAALPAEALDRALEPGAYLGSTDRFVQRALDQYRSLCAELGTG